MTAERIAHSEQLLSKARLTVTEMTDLIASMVSDLPTVRGVAVDGPGGEICVDLHTGKRIELAAIPVARAMNESMNSRLQALDDLFKRCG
ncbi:hypothetical protein EYW49_16855 [Siculibacillus lacustris]|uniref:Uncharacterized protein n=1 Tax=Siculibacillus lacustris TaxID=1549641 RepID=A0A4Q9VJ86_9HYPH|nr:hypothetical protein [Siculibacillus lacustris]TBW35117.1 hypothetical protein EYW49_16855 [Siculibacillus lacustris]